MKKTIFLLLLLIIPFFTIGQDIGIDNNENSSIEKKIIAWADIWKDWWLQLINFWFCNESIEAPTKSINAAVEQWKPFEICAIWNNNSNQDLKLTVDIWYATYTTQWDKTCWKDFSFKDFTYWTEDINQITIPAENYLIKKFDIIFPIGIGGKQEGCLIYNVQTNWLKDGQSWLIPRIRKGFFMNFFVWEAWDIKNETKIENIKTTTNTNKELILSFDVKNIWNVENEITITGAISNWFWFNKNFEISWGIAIPEKTLYLEINLWQVPSYGWLFNIEFTTNTVPHFFYDISQSNIDPNILKEKDIKTKTIYFQTPRLIVWIIVLIIFILFLAFRKPKQKIVYVEKPTTK